MTTPSRICGVRRALVVAGLGLLAAASAQAAAVTVTTPFIALENRGVNSLGFSTGELVRVGANAVTPNGSAGTTGLATHNGVNYAIGFFPSPTAPNFYQRSIPDAPGLRGDWTLRFSNGPESSTSVVSLPAGATQAPFVSSITLSGTSLAPTFSWTVPPGVAVNAYRVSIYDKDFNNVGAGQIGQVVSRALSAGVTSYTLDPSHFTVPGYAFQAGKNYSIEITLIQTRDGTGNSGSANLLATSRVYADFTPKADGSPAVNLPVTLVDGSYQFNMAVLAGRTYYIDPEVAVGYDYAIGAGNPNFQSVDLPDDIGDGLYDLYGFDAAGLPELLAHAWRGGDVFDFGPGGLSRFRVQGIEAAAGLDPSSTTAFVTALTFAGTGQFTGTQKPIVQQVGALPEPGTLLLGALALGAWGLRRSPARGQAER